MKNKKLKKETKHIKKQMLKGISEVFAEAGKKQLNYKQVAAKLDIDDHFSLLLVQEALDVLVKQAELEATGAGKYRRVKTQSNIVGTIDLINSGDGFLVPENGEEDIFISSRNLKSALHGDTVKVFINARRKGKRQTGEVVEILERAREKFVGTLEVSAKYAFLIPDNQKMPVDIFIPISNLNGAKNGEKAIAQITDWPDSGKNPVGKIVEILGWPGANETEMHAILAEYGLPEKFDKSILNEAENIKETISNKDIQHRRDFRKITTFTIDPDDAQDFDDALSVEFLDNGNIRVGIHIADVTHYVQNNSSIEKEAAKRATSVYLADRVVPMLPEKLSNKICSLRPKEEKLCFSAVFELTQSAKIVNQWFGRTVIYSNHRFTYNEAQKAIETKKGNLAKEVNTLHELASELRKQRFANGALNVEQLEVKFKLDENGYPKGVYFKTPQASNWLIEEFMLLANKKVAELIGHKDSAQKAIKTFVYRVHDQPDMEKLKDLKRFVQKLGYKIDLSTPKNIAKSINQLLKDVKGKAEENMIERLSIRCMAKAIYTTKNIGHYGLGFQFYTHFTSPIRRYPDMIVHRLLQMYLDKMPSVNYKDYESKCKHSSEMEKKAQEAERASIKYKQIEYMQDHLGQTFDGIISGVTEWGIFVEISENLCEGMIRLRNIAEDYYYFDEKNYCIRGTQYGKTYRLGETVKIRVTGANLEKRQLDFELYQLQK